MDGPGRNDQMEILYRALLNSCSINYWTLISIIQSIALGFLLLSVEEKYIKEGLLFHDYLLIASTFFILVAAWNEYVMGATVYEWVPSLKDSMIPFLLGAAEFLLVRSINYELWMWFLSAAAVTLAALVAFENMFRSARKTQGKNTKVLRINKSYPWINRVCCVFSSIIFLVFGAYILLSRPSELEKIIMSFIALGTVSIFLFRANRYWFRITEYASRAKQKG